MSVGVKAYKSVIFKNSCCRHIIMILANRDKVIYYLCNVIRHKWMDNVNNYKFSWALYGAFHKLGTHLGAEEGQVSYIFPLRFFFVFFFLIQA